DCPHLRIFTYARSAHVSQDPRSSPHIARFVPVPHGSGVATHVYDLALLAEPRFERRKNGTNTQAQLGWLDGRCVQGAGAYSPRDVDTRLLRNPSSCGRVTALSPNYERVSGYPPSLEVGTDRPAPCSARVSRGSRGIWTYR